MPNKSAPPSELQKWIDAFSHKPQELSAWLTKDQAAEALHASVSTIERMIRRGELENAHRTTKGRKPETVCNPAQIAARIEQPSNPGYLTPGSASATGTPATASLAQVTKTPGPAQAPIQALLAALSQAIAPPRPAKYYTLEQAGKATGLSVQYLRRIIKAGSLSAIRDGRVWKIRERDLSQL